MQLPDGSMVGVPPVDGAFVVNLGDVMTLLTGNYFVATPHRVQARNDRFAIGFFYGPTLDTELASWRRCRWRPSSRRRWRRASGIGRWA